MPQAPVAGQGGSGGVVHTMFGVQSIWLPVAVFPPPSAAAGALIPYRPLRLAVLFSTTPPSDPAGPLSSMPSTALSLLALHQMRGLASDTLMPRLFPVTSLRRTS